MILASLLRYMQFYAHIAHNKLGGETFFQDHVFLGELYEAYEAAYDIVIERMIGLDEAVDLAKVQKDAAKDLAEPKSYEACFKEILTCEADLCKALEKMSKEVTLGTNNMLAALADDSEARQYKLKQRLK